MYKHMSRIVSSRKMCEWCTFSQYIYIYILYLLCLWLETVAEGNMVFKHLPGVDKDLILD